MNSHQILIWAVATNPTHDIPFSLYWLVDRDHCNGLVQPLYNLVYSKHDLNFDHRSFTHHWPRATQFLGWSKWIDCSRTVVESIVRLGELDYSFTKLMPKDSLKTIVKRMKYMLVKSRKLSEKKSTICLIFVPFRRGDWKISLPFHSSSFPDLEDRDA